MIAEVKERLPEMEVRRHLNTEIAEGVGERDRTFARVNGLLVVAAQP